MKLIKQKKLYFTEGKSDKVYEVDLCESQDLFVVNFRYGRRGANLREGTKTVFPVALEEADKIFNKLVGSKEKKGYSEEGGGVKLTNSNIAENPVNSIREETIVKYLQQAIDKTYTRNWKVSKIILRAGVLKIVSASPLIAKFLDSEDEFEQLNAIVVLAGFKDDTHSDRISNIFVQDKCNTKSGRAACAYLLKYGNSAHKELVKREISTLVSEDVVNSLPIYFVNQDNQEPLLLYYAYLFSYQNEGLRKKIYEFVERIGLKVNTFKSIRYIYRTSQIVNDISFLALISKRIAISKPGYVSNYVYNDNSWILADEEKQKPNPSIAFSAKTKAYFNRATYKTVYELSKCDTEAYIQYATQTLCALNDKEDHVSEDVQYFYNYNADSGGYDTVKRYYPKYHSFLALMYILYGNSSRFQHQKNKWYYEEVLTDATPREDVLSPLWNKKQDEVLYILAHSKSDIAVDFALRILKDNPHFLDRISIALLEKLISHYHPRVLDLISEVLDKKYSNIQPETSILLALLKANNDKVVAMGLAWLIHYKDDYFTSSAFIIGLLLTNQIKVIRYLQELYDSKIVYNYALEIEKLQPLFLDPNGFDLDFLIAVNDLIGNTAFGKLLSDTAASKINELSTNRLVSNKLFAINLAKHNSIPAYELFKYSFEDYIKSDEEVLRKAGIALLSHFPDTFLLDHKEDIVSFCFSKYQEVREAIQPTIERLVRLDVAFKNRLLSDLLVVLTEAETYDGLHQNCYEILTKYFDKNLASVSEEQIIILILSKYEFAQNLGTPIFEKRIKLSSLSMPQLVQLAHSDVFAIREKLHVYFKDAKARVNYELEAALSIFNTGWPDVIDWSCLYFDAHIEAENWTVDMLLYACDHVKQDVQAFGIKMITKHFSNEKGLPLLIKLQEHPTKKMQFFVTNYLDGYAKDKPEVILDLENYFKTSLFNINTNRVTKTRIYSFLEQESLKSEAVAKMTVRIIKSVLDTKTMKDRSKNIDVLLAIGAIFPNVENPLHITDLAHEV